MLWGGYRQPECFTKILVVHQRTVVPLHDELAYFFLSLQSPAKAIVLRPTRHSDKVLYEIATAQYQQTPVMQVIKQFCQLIVLFRCFITV